MKLREENKRQIKCMRANIKFLREKNNWSIQELSVISGIDEKVLLHIENGKNFKILYLFKLCSIYNIKPYEIFCPKTKC